MSWYRFDCSDLLYHLIKLSNQSSFEMVISCKYKMLELKNISGIFEPGAKMTDGNKNIWAAVSSGGSIQ